MLLGKAKPFDDAVRSTSQMQRSIGAGEIGAKMTARGSVLASLRQEGSARIGLPRGTGNALEAVLINTSGGMTAGDRLSWSGRAAEGASLSLTTQACERIYRCDGDDAHTDIRLAAEAGSRLAWLPQETILFDRSRYRRWIEADLHRNSEALFVEPVLFGRLAMGESVEHLSFRDDWRIRVDGRLIHAEAFKLHSERLSAELDHPSIAVGMRAAATILFVSDRAEGFLDEARALIGFDGGASLVEPNKLVARLLTVSGYELRKTLIPLIELLNCTDSLPRCWKL